MSFKKILMNLPLFLRQLLYCLTLLSKFIPMIKTFFNPNKNRKVQERKSTAYPQETPGGIVFVHRSDDEVSRTLGDDALKEDPAYLASIGVQPRIVQPVVSPQDAYAAISSQVDDLQFAVDSAKSQSRVVESPVSDNSVNSSNSVNNEK